MLKQNKKQEGFTIIEVMLVLAIAGLIMLIVFLAVPALQRNSRNTQRKNDVSAILAAVNEYSNNNAGKLPTVSGATTTFSTAKANAKLGFYDTASVTGTTAIPTAAPGIDAVTIVMGAKCTDTATAPSAGSGRQFAAYYSVESGNGTTPQCQEG